MCQVCAFLCRFAFFAAVWTAVALVFRMVPGWEPERVFLPGFIVRRMGEIIGNRLAMTSCWRQGRWSGAAGGLVLTARWESFDRLQAASGGALLLDPT